MDLSQEAEKYETTCSTAAQQKSITIQSEEGALCHHSPNLNKTLDVSKMDIVFRGKVWTLPEDPSAKSVVHILERNEALVTWLQPKGGSVEDQIPAINVKGEYKQPSLRMLKSIFRHVRLRKGFVNLESLSQVCRI